MEHVHADGSHMEGALPTSSLRASSPLATWGPETTILFEGVTRSHTKAAHERRHECPSRLALLAINEELACSLR